jgi:hypothetical protein
MPKVANSCRQSINHEPRGEERQAFEGEAVKLVEQLSDNKGRQQSWGLRGQQSAHRKAAEQGVHDQSSGLSL